VELMGQGRAAKGKWKIKSHCDMNPLIHPMHGKSSYRVPFTQVANCSFVRCTLALGTHTFRNLKDNVDIHESMHM
jgi:hypothetical protein